MSDEPASEPTRALPTLEETAAFVAERHAGQTDKAGQPYVGHLHRVAEILVARFADATPAERHAALLHDVLEDTPTTADDLLALGYGPDVVRLVEWVTKSGREMSYGQRIETLARDGPSGALRVKIADLTDNTADHRLAALDPAVAARLKARYGRALRRLTAALRARKQPDGAPTAPPR